MKVTADPPSGVMLIVAVRDKVLVFAAAAQFMVVSPLPDEAEVIVNHEALLDAVHCKVWLLVLIVNDPVPPEPETFAEDGLIVRTAPNCVNGMVTDCVPSAGVTVMFAVRLTAVGVAAAEYCMEPFPFPELPDVIVSQD